MSYSNFGNNDFYAFWITNNYYIIPYNNDNNIGRIVVYNPKHNTVIKKII